jgi:hypothetical protein
MTLPERADYSLTESALSPFPAEPAQTNTSLCHTGENGVLLLERFVFSAFCTSGPIVEREADSARGVLGFCSSG